jgi:hypothetical protein
MTLAYERLGKSRQDAIDDFRQFAPKADSEPTSQLEANLRQNGIAPVELPTEPEAFQQLSDQYGVCIEEHPRWLNFTAGSPDKEGVPEDGHVRKNLKNNDAGMQIQDPKNLFHFNNDLLSWWLAEGRYASGRGPQEFQEFMEHGFDLHSSLVSAAKNLVETLDASYGKMSELYFPGALSNVTFRLLRYDGYDIFNEDGKMIVNQGEQVAKPHYDRGGMTIQAYSSAPGFRIQPEPADGSKRKPSHPWFEPEHGEGKSQVFFGIEHRVIYGSSDPIKALHHKVDRIFDESSIYMPPRTAAIAFIDAPLYDVGITSQDTQPDRVDQDNLKI